MDSRLKTDAFTLLLIIFFVGGLVRNPDWTFALPLSIFYGLLVVQSHVSVRFFSKIIPPIWPQRIIDTLLVILYAVLAGFFNEPVYFAFALCLFFVLATLKYAQLLRIVHHESHLLKYKIMADCLGVLLSLAVLGGILGGYVLVSVWLLVILFALANAFVLRLSPLYIKDSSFNKLYK